MSGWRIDLDVDLCQSHGVCENEAPDHFQLPKRGPVEVVRSSVGADTLTGVENAVKYCPTHAIRLVVVSDETTAASEAGADPATAARGEQVKGAQ